MPRRIVVSLLFIAASLIVSPALFAQSDCPPGGETCIIVFGDIAIGGETHRPDGAVHTTRRAAVFESLVDLRNSFVDETIEDAGEVL